MKSFVSIFGAASSIVLAMGFLFKVCHWPGGMTLLSMGLLMAVVAFVMGCCQSAKEGRLPKWLAVLGIIAAVVMTVGLMMKMLHVAGGALLLLLGVGLYSVAAMAYIATVASKV